MQEKVRKDITEEINALLTVATLIYELIKKWEPNFTDTEARKLAINIATTRKYKASDCYLDTEGIENLLSQINDDQSNYSLCH